MVREWEREYPGRTDNLLKAMANVVPSHLMDRNLFSFATLQRGEPDATGDDEFDALSTPALQPVRPPT